MKIGSSLGKKPQTEPINKPKTALINETTTANNKEILAPSQVTDQISFLVPLVPNQKV